MFKSKLSGYRTYILNWRLNVRHKTNAVPRLPTWKPVDESLFQDVHVSSNLVNHLERLALVDFGNQEAVDRLKAAIQFANQVTTINTENVVPMYTVLEQESLYLRSDEPDVIKDREIALKNATKTDDNYFTAPPGNIPLKPKASSYKGIEKSEDEFGTVNQS